MKKRTIVIAGNWKMNNGPKEAEMLTKEIISKIKNKNIKYILCVPFIDIDIMYKAINGTNIKLGAQNCHWEKSGAFTGEISVDMLKNIGIEYVIIGHSERRQYFNETDESVNKKIISALNQGINPILCVGETLKEREADKTNDVIYNQVTKALENVDKESIKNVIIAYEPIWAIGTGKTATPMQANEICKYIRDIVKKLYGENISDNIIIQYGGSMNPSNAEKLLSQDDIDGGLIGGASLKADDFTKIINIADNITRNE